MWIFCKNFLDHGMTTNKIEMMKRLLISGFRVRASGRSPYKKSLQTGGSFYIPILQIPKSFRLFYRIEMNSSEPLFAIFFFNFINLG
jgi:hypothetical protein